MSLPTSHTNGLLSPKFIQQLSDTRAMKKSPGKNSNSAPNSPLAKIPALPKIRAITEAFPKLAVQRSVTKPSLKFNATLTDRQWQELLTYARVAIHGTDVISEVQMLRKQGSPLREQSRKPIRDDASLREQALSVLSKLRSALLQPTISASHNIWIVKPGVGSRGNGIQIFDRFEEILSHQRQHHSTAYIVQKYLESPFLINGFKFDIRQWVTVTCTFYLSGVGEKFHNYCIVLFFKSDFSD